MKLKVISKWLIATGLLITVSISSLLGKYEAQESDSNFLYVWAGAENEGDSDFLAVINANPNVKSYGEILATIPVGIKGGAHHTEHVMPEGGILFANSFSAGQSFAIDVSDPLNPTIANSFQNMDEYTYPHTFERLPGGNVLVTFQTKGEGNEVAGGLVELDSRGNFIRAADAADEVDPELRAYSVTAIPNMDRAVSTTSDMNLKVEGTSFQVWRLSDLALLKTVRLPEGPLGYEHIDPAEVRVLDDGSVMMTTFTCAMYRLQGLETDNPTAELVYVLPWETYETDECAIPFTRGRFWIQTYAHSAGSYLISLDVSDPSDPIEVDRLAIEGENWWPHWISMEPNGNRLVLTSTASVTKHRVIIVELDPNTGLLNFDLNFGDAASSLPGISFDRSSWPHGAAGTALPHGAVFSKTAPN